KYYGISLSDEGKKGRSSPKEQTHRHKKIGCRFVTVIKKSGACNQQTQDPRKEHSQLPRPEGRGLKKPLVD
ncbi:hypothetical protein, partial [Parasutterella excrementihominis]|uniref:hypothetical protein n=1 Tax=Parasutterella excrementihominis TaxID=487175 RepID=UPI003FF04CF8